MRNDRSPLERAAWRVGSWLPRSWRIAILNGLAWPEFEVKRLWLTTGGVERLEVDDGEMRNARPPDQARRAAACRNSDTLSGGSVGPSFCGELQNIPRCTCGAAQGHGHTQWFPD